MQYEVPHHQMMHQHDMTAPGHYTHTPNLYVPQNTRIKSEHGSERGVSPHGSDTNSRYSSGATSLHHGYPPNLNGIPGGPMRYPSPAPLPPHQVPMIQHSFHPGQADGGYTHQMQPVQPQQEQQPQQQQTSSEGRASTGSSSLPKAFACSTCSKGFARRSDLARHERIHSGVRPHVCDHPGCGKQFIQRSALTVHSRVHTGEKPHMCERCGKPFSDSSSLARHRRIHSGKRPYKCPYADCQKTFTRRTTLTRHQNHHTGTIEESAAATAAALASRASMATRDSGSEGDEYSDHKSPMPTPSTNDRPSSVSPAALNGPIPGMQRPQEYFMGMNGGMNMPPHMRPEMSNNSPRSISPANSQAYLPVNGSRHGSMTSHPTTYPLPNTLEPPTANGSQNGSVNGSPHLPGSGWQSPGHAAMNGAGHNDYPYPDQGYVQNTPNLYYHHNNMHPEPRMNQDIWAQHQQ